MSSWCYELLSSLAHFRIFLYLMNPMTTIASADGVESTEASQYYALCTTQNAVAAVGLRSGPALDTCATAPYAENVWKCNSPPIRKRLSARRLRVDAFDARKTR